MQLKEKILACSFSLSCVRSFRNIAKDSIWFKIGVLMFFPIGFIKYLYLSIKPLKEEQRYKYELSVVAIIKNEGNYIEEWINFYIVNGVDHFYIYDNDSTDDIENILKKYIQRGIVEYKKIPGEKKQCDAYNDAIQKGKLESRYMMVLDLDEFLFATNRREVLKDEIDRIFEANKNIGGIIVNWLLFGSNGIEKKPKGLVIENYIRRARTDFEENKNYKSIVNPRKVIGFACPHYPVYLIGRYAVNENGMQIRDCKIEGSYNKFRINHYFTKSKEEYEIKKNRGKADLNEKRDWSDFDKHNRNDVLDEKILYFVPKIKQRIGEN